MKREIDLMKVVIEGIDRKPYDNKQMEDICKQAGHFVFQKADSHEMLEIGKSFAECKSVKIHEDVAEKLKGIFKESFLFFAHDSINKYIKTKFSEPIGNDPA